MAEFSDNGRRLTMTLLDILIVVVLVLLIIYLIRRV